MLEVRNLNSFYDQSHVLHDISLSLGKGESIALLGRNGAGKTTFLKSLLNGGPRRTGDLSYSGASLLGVPMHKCARLGLSLVPEERRIIPTLTVEENILLGLHAAGAERKAYTLDEVVDLFPMCKPLLKRKGYQLSGGQQQMIAIARGVISCPSILMLDEPAEGLAPVIVDELADTINAVRKVTTMSMLITEQNIDFARATTDRACVIDVGSMVFQGSWSEFDAQPDLVEKYLAL